MHYKLIIFTPISVCVYIIVYVVSRQLMWCQVKKELGKKEKIQLDFKDGKISWTPGLRALDGEQGLPPTHTHRPSLSL